MLLNNILFVSEQTLKNSSLINKNVDDKLLTTPILISQAKYILPIVGTGIYEQLQLQISGNTVTSDNSNLLNYYIQPALIQYAASEALPFIHYQIRNGGLSKSEGDTFIAADLKELNFIIDNLKNTAEYHAQRLIEYLKANVATYPLFDSPGTSTDTVYPNRNNSYEVNMYIPKTKNCKY